MDYGFSEKRNKRKNKRKEKKKHPYKVIELFAGAGGTALGFHNAGLQHVMLTDWDKNATATIKENMPRWNVLQKDITKMDFNGMKADIVEGGFPCQAFSFAGKKMGFDLMVGPEAEFFLFKRKPNGEITTETHDAGAYFDMAPYDEGESARREVVQHLINLGLEIEAAHHEVANGQHEIDFKYEPALRAADNIMTLKFVVKRIAQKYNLHASFMPKPIEGINGSGMHCHMSLMKNDVNLFYDKNSEFELSPLCKHFIAGILKHAKGFSAITNPIINSYKRLIPGFEAPVNIAWSEKNRSPLVRIPAKRGRGTRIEVRVPDTAANPYLAMLTMFAAGLDGVKEKLDPPSPVNKNIFIMSSREKKRLKIEAIPESLDKALDEMKKDKIICDALGNHIASHIYITRKNEWRKYISKVHEWEIKTYLPIY